MISFHKVQQRKDCNIFQQSILRMLLVFLNIFSCLKVFSWPCFPGYVACSIRFATSEASFWTPCCRAQITCFLFIQQTAPLLQPCLSAFKIKRASDNAPKNIPKAPTQFLLGMFFPLKEWSHRVIALVLSCPCENHFQSENCALKKLKLRQRHNNLRPPLEKKGSRKCWMDWP